VKRAKVSIIIPVRNDLPGLLRTLDSLLSPTHGRMPDEVLVVDNGSDDGTHAGAMLVEKQFPDVVRVLSETGVPTSYAARNRGISEASGDILCFIDANMTAPPDYVQQVEAEFAKGADYLGCRVDQYSAARSWAARYDCAFGFPIEHYLRVQHYVPTCCLSIRRKVVDVIGGFDSRLESGGDREFGDRVYMAGFRQVYADNIGLQHPARTSYGALLRKSRRVARGVAQLSYYYPDRYSQAARVFFGWRNNTPRRPRAIRLRYAKAGDRISIGGAVLVALLMMPLRWTRPLAWLRETARLRSSAPVAAHQSLKTDPST
jgi:glycosyltransferase AglI